MTPAVAARDIRVAFDHGPAVLEGLDLTIAPGERVGLIGPNGAGKTTLLLALIGLRPLAGGSLQVAGLDAARKSNWPTIRQRVGVVFQRPDDQLFSASVFDDVAFGPLNLGLGADAVEQRTHAALERVGAAHLAGRVSHHLSAGEQRRVALACVLVMAPETIVLDEPTSDLDPRGRGELLRLLGGLDQTLIVASHDLEFVRASCQRVVVLDGGKAVADRSTDSILDDRALLEAHGLAVNSECRTQN
jgi:cobalt/nickel transport system ATP-binding protein